MASLVRAWPAVAGALLLFAAFPPLNLGLLVFVALVPWFVSLRTTTPKGALKSGYVFGFVYLLCQMSWLQPLVWRWTHDTLLSWVPFFAAPAIGGLYFLIAGWLIRYCWVRNWPWMIPVVWAAVEVLRSYCPGLAFPWGLLATPLWPFPAFIQLAWLGTVFLVSAWVALASVAVAQLMAGDGLMKARPYLAAFLVLGLASALRYSNPTVGTRTPITIGQLGLDLAFGDKAENAFKLGPIVEGFQEAAVLQRSRLLVLPEGLVRGGNGIPPLLPFRVTDSIPILFGGQRGEGPTYQSAFGFDGEWTFADKTRLVVFGEYVPGRDFLPFLTYFKLPTGDLTPGEKVSSLEVGGIRIGPLLCFEGLFPDVALAQAANDVQMLAIMSLDDWYFETQAPEQLMTAAVFRAVETGLPVVRAAPLGYSVAVSQRGDLIAQAPLKKSAPMRVEVILPPEPDRFPGIWVFLYAAPALSLALLGLSLWDRKRPVGEPAPDDAAKLKNRKTK